VAKYCAIGHAVLQQAWKPLAFHKVQQHRAFDWSQIAPSEKYLTEAPPDHVYLHVAR
jgi:hypothetical protein